MNAREHKSETRPSRYYESSLFAWAVKQDLKKARVRADDIEQLVVTTICELLRDRPGLRVMLMRIGVLGPINDRLTSLGRAAAARLARMPANHLSLTLKATVSRVEVTSDVLRLLLRPAAIARFLEWDGRGTFRVDELEIARASDIHFIEVPAALTTMRRKPYIPIAPRIRKIAEPNAGLVKLIGQARVAQDMVFTERDRTLSELAQLNRMRPAGFSRLVRLNYLAPDIVASILDGEQPAGLTRKQLLKFDLPIDWKNATSAPGLCRQAGARRTAAVMKRRVPITAMNPSGIGRV